MATYIRGDIHGDLIPLISFVEWNKLDCSDNIIILGDAGLCWYNDESDMYQNIELWEKYGHSVKLYFIDGNHENFNILNSLPIENNMGVLSKHMFYLRRGQTYEFEGKKVLVCGGADSVDKNRRIEGKSWWADETITKANIDSIAAGHYDYVLTHCCPRSVFENNKMWLSLIGNVNEFNAIHTSEDRLEELLNKITFDKWYFAHYHVNNKLDDKFHCLYQEFVELN